jgi:hypothetical protein
MGFYIGRDNDWVFIKGGIKEWVSVKGNEIASPAARNDKSLNPGFCRDDEKNGCRFFGKNKRVTHAMQPRDRIHDLRR